jgi:hypothetical protein
VEVELSENKNSKKQVRNYLATATGNKIVKVTEIQLKDRIVRIIDSYFLNQTNSKSLTSEEKPVPQFHNYVECNELDKKQKKLVLQNNHKDSRTRDTKNVVKNIFRLFQTWIH